MKIKNAIAALVAALDATDELVAEIKGEENQRWAARQRALVLPGRYAAQAEAVSDLYSACRPYDQWHPALGAEARKALMRGPLYSPGRSWSTGESKDGRDAARAVLHLFEVDEDQSAIDAAGEAAYNAHLAGCAF